jgi:integrase
VHAARKALDALRVMLTFAVRGEILDRNPALGISIPQPPADPDAPPPVERVLDPGELAALLGAWETPREQVIVRLAAESGLRAGEVRGLRWPDVDMAARRVTVRPAVWRDVVKLPKGTRPRRIAITPALAEAFADLYELEVLERGRDGRGYVLTGRDGVLPLGADTPLEVAQQVQARAGLVVERPSATRRGKTARKRKPKTRVTYHELRHTAATVMLTGGASATVVARQLGHADSRITTQVYEHLLHDGLLDEALTAFDRLPEVAGRVAGAIAPVGEEAANPLE